MILVDRKPVLGPGELKNIQDTDSRFAFESPKVGNFGKVPTKSLSPARKLRQTGSLTTKHSVERLKKGNSLSNYSQGKLTKASTLELTQNSNEKFDLVSTIIDKYSSPAGSRSNSKGRSINCVVKHK